MKSEEDDSKGINPFITWTDETYLKEPADYYIAQITEMQVILVLHIVAKTLNLRHNQLPLLMEMDNRDMYTIGDVIAVKSYRIMIYKGEKSQSQIFGRDRVADCLEGGYLRANARAITYECKFQRTVEITSVFVQSVHPGRFISVVGWGLKDEEHIYGKDVRMTEYPSEGQLIEVEASFLEENSLEFEVIDQERRYRYYLPKEYIHTETKWKRVGKRRYYPRWAYLARKETLSLDEQIRSCELDTQRERGWFKILEKVLYSSIIYAQYRVRTDFLSTIYAPQQILVSTETAQPNHKHAELNFVIEYEYGEDAEVVYAKRKKFWKVGQELRIEKIENDPQVQKDGIIATITEVKIDDSKKMFIKCIMTHRDVTLASRFIPQLFQGKQNNWIKLYPNPECTGYEAMASAFLYRKISYGMLDYKHPFRRNIMRQLWDLPFQGKLYGKGRVIKGEYSLNNNQKEMIKTLSNSRGYFVLAQGPAGSGKTQLVAAHLCELMINRRGAAIVVAPTELAIQNIFKRISQFLGNVPVGNILMLQSPFSEKLYPENKTYTWQRYRVPETLNHILNKVKNPTDIALINDYLEKRLNHEGRGYREREALEIAYKLCYPQIVLGTEPMIVDFLEQCSRWRIHCNLNYLVIDEGSLISEAKMMTLAAMMPDLLQVFVTSDKFQIETDTVNLPEQIIPYGHRRAVDLLVQNIHTVLWYGFENYRSHPLLVEALTCASYEGQLVSRLERCSRNMWKQLGLGNKHIDAPILFLRVKETEQIESRKNAVDQELNKLAAELWVYIKNSLPFASVIILCYYSSAMEDLKCRISPEDVYSVKELQGQETDIVIVLTTRTGMREEVDESHYRSLLNEKRTTMVLSRAKEGIIIIGDTAVLDRGTVWKKFLTCFPITVADIDSYYHWLEERRNQYK